MAQYGVCVFCGEPHEQLTQYLIGPSQAQLDARGKQREQATLKLYEPVRAGVTICPACLPDLRKQLKFTKLPDVQEIRAQRENLTNLTLQTIHEFLIQYRQENPSEPPPTFHNIQQYLNYKKIPTHRGRRWTAQNVGRFMANYDLFIKSYYPGPKDLNYANGNVEIELENAAAVFKFPNTNIP